MNIGSLHEASFSDGGFEAKAFLSFSAEVREVPFRRRDLFEHNGAVLLQRGLKCIGSIRSIIRCAGSIVRLLMFSHGVARRPSVGHM